jgi:hypothetical protein
MQSCASEICSNGLRLAACRFATVHDLSDIFISGVFISWFSSDLLTSDIGTTFSLSRDEDKGAGPGRSARRWQVNPKLFAKEDAENAENAENED